MKKFNWLDLVIIVLVIAVAVGGVYYFTRNKDEEKITSTIAFTVDVSEIPKDAAEGYKEKVEVSFGLKNQGKGFVEFVQVDHHYKDVPNITTGQFERRAIEGYYDARVTIVTKVTESDLEFLAGDEPIAIGKDIIFHGKGFAGDGYIIGIQSVETDTEGDNQ